MAKKSSSQAKSKKPPTTSPAPSPVNASTAASFDDTGDLGDTGDIGDTPDLPDTPALGAALGSAHESALGMALGLAPSSAVPFTAASGDDIVAQARRHLGEKYVLGARAPMGNATWRGPWDCAEFVSWCVFQASGVLYGTEPRNDPMLADAFTGFWAQQALAGGHLISVAEAAGIAGAAVLRRPRPGAIGHIVISDGQGGTLEAHSSLRGVIADTLSGRRWDSGILVPGIRYLRESAPVALDPPPAVLRLTQPLTRGEAVRVLQARLLALGLAVGSVDGVYGPQTAHVVRRFQASKGLVPDGEFGPSTMRALALA